MTTNDSSYIYDSENATEMARLINLDRIATASLGGPLNGLPPLPEKARLLDLGCGPGGWVLDVAFMHRDFEVCGVDISRSMIDYANARAQSQGLPNASFGIMDILKPLDFDDASFDLVNARFLSSVLKRDTWPLLIAECMRILRPNGILRLTEGDDLGISTSPATERLSALAIQTSWRLGYGFSPDGRTLGMSAAIVQLLRQAGYRDIHIIPIAVEYSAHTEGWDDFRRNNEIIYQYLRPAFISLNLATPEEIERLRRQALVETYSDDFTCIAHVISAWGRSPREE
ncbi:MAG: class I SAM-dependent methyltransferase [Ktedonobacteraceae bacterium]|nr:class I SAM-dependent methyltransferase [Ktedonobacteraceae bacterium]